MHTGISKPNTRKSGGEKHLTLSLIIFGVLHCPRKVLNCASEGLQGEDVADRVGTLIRRTIDWVRRARHSLIIRDSSPTLQAVAQHIKTRTCVNGRRHGPGIQGITYSQSGLEIAMRNSSLSPFRDEVKDSSAGGL